jgi:hypothetical protein
MKWTIRIGVGLVVAGALVGAPRAQVQAVAWGDNSHGACDVPALPPGRAWVELAAGAYFSMGRLDDGSVVAWGEHADVPGLPPGLTYSQLSAEYLLPAALRSDGSVVAWGPHAPALPPEPAYRQVGVGFFHVLAVHADGSIRAWGNNHQGQLDVPALPPGISAVQVDGGVGHSVALLSDGSVIAWGRNAEGQCDVPALPVGSTYVEIAAHGYFTAARRSDGTVVAWGNGSSGQLAVPAPPAGLGYVAVDAGSEYTLALVSDGTIVAVGANHGGQLDVPPLMSDSHFIEVVGGHKHTLARVETVSACGGFAVNYCASTPNSTGKAAAIIVRGSLRVSDDEATLESFDCPPGRVGFFFYGSDPAKLPMVNGYLCVSPFSPGLFRLPPVAVVNSQGHAERAIDFGSPNPAGLITPGSTWNFQYWFRDGKAGGAGSNLSNAVRVTFCP